MKTLPRLYFKPISIMLAALPFSALAEDIPDNEVVITASRIYNPRSNASKLNAADIAPLTAATSDTAKLLSDIPGVSLYNTGGVSSLPAIHGMADDRVNTQVNGMNLVSSCPNHMNSPLSYIDPTHVESVKVFAGITPVSVGGNSIGGTVQVISASPEFAEHGQGTLLKGETGPFYRSNGNAYGINVGATLATENMNLTYSGSTAQSGAYKAASNFKPAATSGNTFLPGDVVGSSSYKSQNQNIGLAMRRDNHLFELNVGVQNIPYEGYPNQRMDMTGNTSSQINLHYTGQYEWGKLDSRIYDQTVNHNMNFGADKQFWYGAPATIPGMPMNTDGKTVGAMVKADIVLSGSNILRVGADAQNYQLNDWWSPSGGAMMAPNTFWNIYNGKRNQYGVYSELETRWNQVWLSQFGVRSDTVDMNSGNVQGYNTGMMYAPDAAAFNALNHQHTDHNWDITALTRYTPGLTESFETGYSRKTRSPNLYELYSWSKLPMAMVMNNFVGDGNGYVGNLNLRPEVANTLSVTADWHDADKEHWGVQLTPYYTYIQNYIDVQRCASASCGATNVTATTGFVNLQYTNQTAQIFGVDLSGRMLLGSSNGYGSFTGKSVLNYTRGENLTTGDNLYNIMPLNAKLSIEQSLTKWTNVAEVQIVSAKTHVSQVRNEIQTGGYSLVNLRSSYAWDKKTRIDIGIDNLFNKFYSLPLGGAYVGQGSTMGLASIPWGIAVPGMARSIYAGLNVKF